ncbi:cysteine proteinase [Irpex rosettiformis]|uniref:Cysteine proteinase n=1 Tax=Irpex rosettiformis TaxID=378272 RepID=A0ACB8U187_9APHY|nr:cysteine proteinase [Irpex rosettiformis]
MSHPAPEHLEHPGQTSEMAGDSSTVCVDQNDAGTQDMTKLSTLELQELTQQLLDEEASKRPLISSPLPISSLREEYERGSGNFIQQIDYLVSQGYTHVRRTRGDGDCFYRSLAFAWIQRLLQSPSPDISVATALSLLDSSLDVLKAAGFQDFVFEYFYDVLVDVIRSIVIPGQDGKTLDEEGLLKAFQDPETSNCIVVFLRLYTSAVIRTSVEEYAPFLFHPETGEDISPQDFCERFVEATGKEADHIQMTALTKALKVNVRVAYLDGHSATTVNFVDFLNNEDSVDGGGPAVLLYRPGHYDILESQAKA